MSDVKPETVKVRCPACSKKLGLPPQAVGRKAKCPACAHVFRVGAAPTANPTAAAMSPAVPPVPPESRAAGPSQDEPSSLFDALAAAEQSAAEIELSPEEQAAAHSIRSASDAAERAAREGAVEPPPVPARGQARGRGGAGTAASSAEGSGTSRMPSAIGTLAKGCLFSAGAALLGAFICYAVAKGLGGAPVKYMALGIGLLAGFGMHLGIRAESVIAGVIAAFIALAGVVGAELMVVAWVVVPEAEKEVKAEIAKADSDLENQRETLVEAQTEKLLKSRGINPEDATEEQEEKAATDAEKLVNSWNETKVRSEYKQYKASHPEASEDSGSLKDMPTGFFVLFFLLFFGLKGIFFCILAMVSAFKIGASGLSFGSS